MTRALIDGDEVLFKACVIKHADHFADEGDDDKRPPTFEQAKDTLLSLLSNWRGRSGCEAMTVCLSPDDRKLFRHGIDPTYKGGRGEKPEHFWPLVSWLRETHECVAIPGLEADDVMGIMSNVGTIIVSSDKDMRTIPGRIYSPYTDKFSTITKARADWQWMYQTLTGDSTDGYKGAVGIGPKKAESILSDAGVTLSSMWPAVVDTFLSKGQSKKDAERNAMLARILRPGDLSVDQTTVGYGAGHTTFTLNIKAMI